MTCNWDYATGDINRRECGLCLRGGQEPHPACDEHRKDNEWGLWRPWRDELGWWAVQ
jgi:hypothetical protein